MSPVSQYPQKLTELLDEFRELSDREVQMSYLIECGERFREVPASVAVRPFEKDRLVPGCESEAYIWAVPASGGTLDFHFAVENPQGISAKAMAVILSETLSRAPLEQVASVSQEIVYDFFTRNISMGKGQGLMNMVGIVTHLAKQEIQRLAANAC